MKFFNSMYLLNPSFGLCKILLEFLVIYKKPPSTIFPSVSAIIFLLSLYNLSSTDTSGLNNKEIFLSSSKTSFSSKVIFEFVLL